MVSATDQFIVTENLLLFVSSKRVTSIWYRQWEVQSTCAGPICIGVVQTDIFTVISCKYVLLQYSVINGIMYVCVCVCAYTLMCVYLCVCVCICLCTCMDGARFSAPVQIGPRAQPTYCTMGTGYFQRVKRPGRGVDHPPHLAPRLKKE